MRGRILNTATWIGACSGVAFLIIALFCVIFGYSVVLFSTGSMAPTVPRGSLSLVKSVPAAQVNIGDVLTVERHNSPPLTHRVIEIRETNDPNERVVLMQGDANASPDPESYTITEGRIQVFSIPGLAYPFQRIFGNPWAAIALFVLIGSLCTWAFWPAKQPRHAGSASDRRGLNERASWA